MLFCFLPLVLSLLEVLPLIWWFRCGFCWFHLQLSWRSNLSEKKKKNSPIWIDHATSATLLHKTDHRRSSGLKCEVRPLPRANFEICGGYSPPPPTPRFLRLSLCLLLRSLTFWVNWQTWLYYAAKTRASGRGHRNKSVRTRTQKQERQDEDTKSRASGPRHKKQRVWVTVRSSAFSRRHTTFWSCLMSVLFNHYGCWDHSSCNFNVSSQIMVSV